MSPQLACRLRRHCRPGQFSSISIPSGLTIVVVEHDVAFVRDVAQRITVMHQGRIFAEGTVNEITEHADVRRIYLGQA